MLIDVKCSKEINLKELAVTNSFFLRKCFSERDLHGVLQMK